MMKATELRGMFGDYEPTAAAKRLKHWKKRNYKTDHHRREIRCEEKLEYREVEVPGENLRVNLPRGVVCHRLEHRGFEYLLYLDDDTGSLKHFEKRRL